MSVFLTWTIPLRAALVSVDQYGKAKQAAVGRVGGERAALGLVEQDELVVDADVPRALIDNLCIRRLDGNNKKIKHRGICNQERSLIICHRELIKNII